MNDYLVTITYRENGKVNTFTTEKAADSVAEAKERGLGIFNAICGGSANVTSISVQSI